MSKQAKHSINNYKVKLNVLNKKFNNLFLMKNAISIIYIK